MNRGVLYLIPVVISEDTQGEVLSPRILQVLPSLQYFLAENVRTARRFLSSLKIFESIEPLQFQVLDKDTKREDLPGFFKPLFDGHAMGILSESGCPGVADPGALAVEFAHRNGIRVVPLVGPSSILLALMASGLNGQSFAFNGYLPIEARDQERAVKELEKESRVKNQTQIFIETPYRNKAVLNSLLKLLKENTLLTIAVDITGKNEWIKTMEVGKWKTAKPELLKFPAIFLFLAT